MSEEIQENQKGESDAKLGRPPLQFTKEQLDEIDLHATHQCKDNLIAVKMGIDSETFKRHFEERCRLKRAEGKAEKLKQQYNDTTPTMLIWFGKQHLEQIDKQDLNVQGTITLADIAARMGAGLNAAQR
jgi:hypothetical protein